MKRKPQPRRTHMARKAPDQPPVKSHPVKPPEVKPPDPPAPPPPPPDDVGKELATFEKRIKVLEGKPAPWWHYALVLAVGLGILFGGEIMARVQATIKERTRGTPK